MVGEKLFPEAATLAHRGESGFYPLAQPARIARQQAEVLRQQRFQLFTQNTGQHGGVAAGGDGDHQRRMVDNGGHYHAGLFRRIHQIAKNPLRFGGDRHLLIYAIVIGGGDNQPACR